MPSLKIALLGTPVVECDGETVTLSRRKALALLAYLAAEGRPQAREELAILLSPDFMDKRARDEVRRALATLRETPLTGWIEADRNHIALRDDDTLLIDVHQFDRLLENAPDAAALQEAIDLYRADFMSGFSLRNSSEFEHWQALQLQVYQQKLLSALEQLVHLHTTDQNYDAAIVYLQRWLEVDELNEHAHQLAMRVYALAGQRAAALKQYEFLAALLDREMGILPHQETSLLYEHIKNDLAVPGTQVWPAQHGNMPPAPALVVGRETTLREISVRLREPGAGAMIIQGWPGIGKTTLAAALAHDGDLRSHFFDGVLWASLGEHPNLLTELKTWANALGIPDLDALESPDQVFPRIAAQLQDRKMLLIVDDIWDARHFGLFRVGGAACAILATTRLNEVAEGLATEQVHIFKAPILSEDDSLSLLRVLAADIVAQYPKEMRQLVRDLEGLPLALQVAGRMLRAEMSMGWGITDLLEDLREGAALLNAPAPADRVDLLQETTPTVAALLQRSTELLDDTGKTCFALLGVFAPKPATFDLPALSAVWNIPDPKKVVRQLVDRGLMEPVGSGRFQVHALLIAHARQLAEQHV